MEHRVYRRGINDFGTKRTEFHTLDETHLAEYACIRDDTGVGSHEAVYIGPYLQEVSVEGSGYQSCGIIRASATEVCDFAGVTVTRDKPSEHRMLLQGECKRLFYQLLGKLTVGDILVKPFLGFDELR